MLCPHCGKPIEEGAATCPYCGASLQPDTRPEVSAPIYTRPPVADPPPPYQSSETPVIQLMRQMARSPYFLVPAIGYTCMVVFNLLAILQSASPAGIDRYLAQVLPPDSSGELESFSRVLSTALSASAAGALVGYIPTILIAVGIWMTFASAVDRSGAPIKTAGLTMIRVLQIIGLVVVCLMTLMLVVLFGIMIASLGGYDESGATAAVLAVALVIVLAVIALMILYMVKILSTIDCFRQSIWTGTPRGKISAYVAVLCILGGVVCLFTVLFGGVMGLLVGISGAVSSIGFGVLLFHCRKEFRQLSAPAETVYPH